MVITTVPVIPC